MVTRLKVRRVGRRRVIKAKSRKIKAKRRPFLQRKVRFVIRGGRRVKLKKPVTVKKSLLTGLAVGTAFATGLTGAGRLALGFIGRKALARPVLSFIGIPAVTGVLLTSPTAREFISPKGSLQRGKAVGSAIEDPSGFLAGIRGTAGKLAPAVIPATLLAGGLVLGGKILGKIKDRDISLPSLPSRQIPIAQLPVATAQALTPTTAPLGAVQKPKPIEEVKPVKAVPSVKIVNKPQVNVSFRKSRRFINQQVVVKR